MDEIDRQPFNSMRTLHQRILIGLIFTVAFNLCFAWSDDFDRWLLIGWTDGLRSSQWIDIDTIRHPTSGITECWMKFTHHDSPETVVQARLDNSNRTVQFFSDGEPLGAAEPIKPETLIEDTLGFLSHGPIQRIPADEFRPQTGLTSFIAIQDAFIVQPTDGTAVFATIVNSKWKVLNLTLVASKSDGSSEVVTFVAKYVNDLDNLDSQLVYTWRRNASSFESDTHWKPVLAIGVRVPISRAIKH